MIAAFFLTDPVLAKTLQDLFQAEILVPDQSNDNKSLAIKAGFEQVLIRVTGDSLIKKNPYINSNLRRAEYYVQDFNYLLPSPSSAQYLLRIHYNSNDILYLLKKAGLSFWQKNRPLLLAYVIINDQNQTSLIIDNESTNDVFNLLKKQSKNCGLPLIFPVMDMTDVNSISTDEILHMNIPVLKQAAKRYQPDGLLIGNIEQTAKSWTSTWRLVLNENQWDWTTSDTNSENLIATALSQANQFLLKQRMEEEKNKAESWFDLEIVSLVERQDLNNLLIYFKKFSAIKEIVLSEVSDEVVIFKVHLQGPLEAFQKYAALNPSLRLEQSESTSEKIIYQWHPSINTKKISNDHA